MRVHLMGGLGNQLFIYAAALDFARRWNVALAVDAVSAFAADRVYRREYLLDQFSITAPLSAATERFVGRWRRLVWRVMIEIERRGLARDAWAVVGEKTPAARYNARVLHFFGYWQSENYFAESADAVRREFRISAALPPATAAELAAIQSQPEPVMVGIRRFNDRPDPAVGYTTPREFYETAFAEIARRVPRAHVFFVTEDPAWVAQNIRCQLPHTLVTHKAANRRAFEDLALMQACRHFVIGNSTYHWWGAWLGEKTSSLVLADGKFASENPDYFPSRWSMI